MIRAVLTDIEGTTSALSFVKDVLFPYARRHIDGYLRAHAGEAPVAALLEEVRHEMGQPSADLAAVSARLIEWIDHDRKVTPLKALQGLIWEAGYIAGDFTGHVYEVAVTSLRDASVAALTASRAPMLAALTGFFAEIAPLEAEMIRSNAFRQEELLRWWMRALGGGIAGETPADSAARLAKLDYKKALVEYAAAEKARAAEAEKRAQALKEAAEREAEARGWRE